MQSLPESLPALLDPEEIRSRCRFCGLDEEAQSQLLETARRIAAEPGLLRLAWHIARLSLEYPPLEGARRRLPPLERSLGDRAGCFYLLCALDFVPRLKAHHQALGVPEEVTRETCLQIRSYIENFSRGFQGRLGVYRPQMQWLRSYLHGNLYFRLGRMEYWAKPMGGAIRVFRNRATGEVAALATEGTRFAADGLVCMTADEKPAWVASLTEDEAAIEGCPVSPLGKGLCPRIRLPRTEWSQVLAKGDMVLDMHIPAGGGMTPEACASSMRRAANFFRSRFPHLKPAAIVCTSWLFHPQLAAILPSDANLLLYQRELHLFPIATNPRDGIWFIFLQDELDPATAPRETSLQRSVLDYLAAGNSWKGGGGMFFLLEDLPEIGSQVYRRRWPPKSLASALA